MDAAALPPPAAPATSQRVGVPGVVAVCLAVLLGVAAAVVGVRRDTSSSAEAGGYLIGSLLGAIGIPFLIAYLIAGRKKSRNPRNVAWIFSVIVFFFAGSNLIGNLGALRPETGEELAGRLMREAAGLQPAHHSILPSRRKMEDALRGEFKKIVQTNRDYTEKVAVIDTSAVKELNTARSFVQHEVGDLALKQVHALYDLDAAQEQNLAVIISDLRQVLASTASSGAEREALEKSFDKGIRESLTKRSTALAAEKAWLDSLDAEYQYARAHQANLHEENGKVVIYGNEILAEFNRRLQRQKALREEFVTIRREFAQFQTQSLKKAGLSEEDVGSK